MKTKLYFRPVGGYSFSIDVVINSERHLTNFLASMTRKGYQQVDRDFYETDERIKSQFKLMYK